MSISVRCENGHLINAKESYAGKNVACPKCGAQVQIPVLIDEVVEIPDEIDIFGNINPPAPAGNSETPDLFSGAIANFPQAQFNTSTPPRPSAEPEKTNSSSSQVLLIIGGVAAGLFVCMCLMIGLAFMYFSERGEDRRPLNQPVIAQSSQPDSGRGPSAYSLPAEAPWTDPAELRSTALINVDADNGIQAQLTPISLTAAPAAHFATETQDIRPQLDQLPDVNANSNLSVVSKKSNLLHFSVPSLSWRAAYDANSGNLMLSNDFHGFLCYSIGAMASRNVTPIRKYGVAGIPSAICCKPTANGNLFIFTGSHDESIYVVDAKTGEPRSRIKLELQSTILNIHSSSNPSDPYIYVLSNAIETSTRQSSAVVGRINVSNGEQEYDKINLLTQLAVSPAGDQLYLATDHNSFVGSWERIRARTLPLTVPDQDSLPNLGGWRNAIRLTPLSHQLIIGSNIHDLSGKHVIRQLAFTPLAGFEKLPIIVGAFENGDLCFASQHDGYIVESMAGPKPSTNTTQTGVTDFRRIFGRNESLGSEISHAFCDDNRGLALIVTDQALLIAKLDKKRWASEPEFKPAVDVPPTIFVDQPARMPLIAKDATVEIVRLSTTPADSQLATLGQIDLKTLAHLPLSIEKVVEIEDTSIELSRSDSGLKASQKIRVDNEVMTIVSVKDKTAQVKRNRPVWHQPRAMALALDDQGIATIDYSAKPATPNNPSNALKSGKLILAAGMNSTQNKVFVNDVDGIAGRSIPFSVRIDDEIMQVVGYDEVTSSLQLSRSAPVAHRVTSPMIVVEENTASAGETEEVSEPNLPEVRDGFVHWQPAPDQLGTQTLLLRITERGICRDEIHKIEVATSQIKFDAFRLTGVEMDGAGSSLAVVWGFTESRVGGDSQSGIPPDSACIGVFDFETQQLIQHRVLPRYVASATMHGDRVIACLTQWAPSQMALAKQRQNQLPPNEMLQSRIYSFDAKTLEIEQFTFVDQLCSHLRVIADRYLGVQGTYGKSFGYQLDGLIPTSTEWTTTVDRTFGRIGNDWVWEGVLWDEQFTKPKLLISPSVFRSNGTLGVEEDKFLTSTAPEAPNVVRPICDGFCSGSCIANSSASNAPRGLELHDMPTHLIANDNRVFAGKSNQFSPVIASASDNPTGIFRAVLPRKYQSNALNSKGPLDSIWLAEKQDQLLVCLQGKLFVMSKNSFRDSIDSDEEFRIEHRQETFTLSLDQEHKLKYHAPGATNYTLALHTYSNLSDQVEAMQSEPRLGYQNKRPLIPTSKTGEFNVTPTSELFAQHGRGLNHVPGIAALYQQLVGKPLQNVVVPYYAVVVAERSDLPHARAVLVHAYLVEVPNSALPPN